MMDVQAFPDDITDFFSGIQRRHGVLEDHLHLGHDIVLTGNLHILAVAFCQRFQRFTLQALDELGFDHENVYTTLEKRMKCGIGICGRCGIGGKYVCLDGPVFSQKELDNLPPEL